MPNFGSSSGLVSQNLSQTMDNQGNPIISSDTTFGASPLGYAARVQALFGLPNATFELTPPDTTATINQGNQLPYWDIQDYSAGVMSGSAIYDSTTNTWGIKLNPGTATTGDYLTMTTRSYLVNDDNLSLRQKALAVVAKNGTYSSTTQWNMNLTATYYDGANTVLHSGTVATILDNTTWTSMAGTTTTGGTAINGAAQYVDLTFTLTATAPVTSSTSVTIKSVLLQTSAGAAASQSFLVAERFTTSQTWTVPTGVQYLLAIVGQGAGGGGGGGSLASKLAASLDQSATGGGGGGAGAFAVLRDVYIGAAGSYSVAIGAGGAGGTAPTATTRQTLVGGNGAVGGATSFGTIISLGGGAAGSGGFSTDGSGTALNGATGGAGGAATSVYYGAVTATGGTGGTSGSVPLSGSAANASAGGSGFYSASTVFPYVDFAINAGDAGGTATGHATASKGTAGAGGAASLQGAGGGGASSKTGTGAAFNSGNGAAGGAGGGGGGGAGVAGSALATSIGGAGGAAGSATGGGGGGGGAATYRSTAGNAGVSNTVTAGVGGSASSGWIVIAYVG